MLRTLVYLLLLLQVVTHTHGQQAACCDGSRFSCVCSDDDVATLGSHAVYDFEWLIRDYVTKTKADQLRQIITNVRHSAGSISGQCLVKTPSSIADTLPRLQNDHCVYLSAANLVQKLTMSAAFVFAACDEPDKLPYVDTDRFFFLTDQQHSLTWYQFGSAYIEGIGEQLPESLFTRICTQGGDKCVGPKAFQIADFYRRLDAIFESAKNLLDSQTKMIGTLDAKASYPKETAPILSSLSALRMLTSVDSCGFLPTLDGETVRAAGAASSISIAAATGHHELLMKSDNV